MKSFETSESPVAAAPRRRKPGCLPHVFTLLPERRGVASTLFKRSPFTKSNCQLAIENWKLEIKK